MLLNIYKLINNCGIQGVESVKRYSIFNLYSQFKSANIGNIYSSHIRQSYTTANLMLSPNDIPAI